MVREVLVPKIGSVWRDDDTMIEKHARYNTHFVDIKEQK